MQDLIMQQIRNYFQKNKLKFREEQNVFSSHYALHGKIRVAFLNVAVRKGTVLVMVAPDVEIPEEQFTDMECYVNAVNFLLSMGCLYLDKKLNGLTFRMTILSEENLLPDSQIEAVIETSCLIVWSIAKVLPDLLEGKLSPEEAAMQTVHSD